MRALLRRMSSMGLERSSTSPRVLRRRHDASFLRNCRDRQRGIALIWTALFLFLFVGFVGLACDWAYVLLVAHQLQNAADAGSLAGAQFVRPSSSISTAETRRTGIS
jgi:Flp pilus assembly protein TadG